MVLISLNYLDVYYDATFLKRWFCNTDGWWGYLKIYLIVQLKVGQVWWVDNRYIKQGYIPYEL
jgi:hypothetical protein